MNQAYRIGWERAFGSTAELEKREYVYDDPQQQSMIREAMKSIAERKPGRSKLVYDKTKRTIVAVAEGTQTTGRSQ